MGLSCDAVIFQNPILTGFTDHTGRFDMCDLPKIILEDLSSKTIGVRYESK
jgi:hypothetical protein